MPSFAFAFTVRQPNRQRLRARRCLLARLAEPDHMSSANTTTQPSPHLTARLGEDEWKKWKEKARGLQGFFFFFVFSSSNCLLQFFRPLPSPTQKGKQGRKLSVQGKVRISLGGGGWGECTITAEARAFLYASPAPSACSMTHTHTHTCRHSGHKAFTISGPLHIQMPEEVGEKMEIPPALAKYALLHAVYLYFGGPLL